MADPSPPSLGHLAWLLAIRWKAEVEAVVAPFGLSHAQYAVLAGLRRMQARRQAPTQRELAAQLGLTPIFVSKLIRALAAEGLVARRSDPADSRAIRLGLTERGAEVAAAARAGVRALERRMAGPLGTVGGRKGAGGGGGAWRDARGDRRAVRGGGVRDECAPYGGREAVVMRDECAPYAGSGREAVVVGGE